MVAETNHEADGVAKWANITNSSDVILRASANAIGLGLLAGIACSYQQGFDWRDLPK